MMAQFPTQFHCKQTKDGAQDGLLLFVFRPSSWRAADDVKTHPERKAVG